MDARPLSTAYASNQYRALQQFFKWLAAEDQLPDPMAGLAPPRVTDKLVPVFTPGELTRLEQACAGRSFTQRRDTAIIAVLSGCPSWPACGTTPATRGTVTWVWLFWSEPQAASSRVSW